MPPDQRKYFNKSNALRFLGKVERFKIQVIIYMV
jgi:hypothetical protein